MQTEILIAGAGLGGLSLAAALEKNGTDYLLVEARDRLGGRILSAEFSDQSNAPSYADLGPSWIWPGQGHIAALLNDLEIGVFEQYSSGRLVYEDELGQVRRDLDYSSMAGSLRIDGGIAAVTDKLAARLGDGRIYRGHRVSCIREADPGYQVDLVHGDSLLQVEARKVVLAIPPRLIASRIEFDPPLDNAIIEEMDSVPTWMAGHAKLFAIYEEPFWRAQGLSGDGISRLGRAGPGVAAARAVATG